MRRVLRGKTYDTEPATEVAKYTYLADDDKKITVMVYQTQQGNFFMVDETPSDDGESTYEFATISKEAIVPFMQRADDFEILDPSALPEPPEA
jgi:hypothetical protein